MSSSYADARNVHLTRVDLAIQRALTLLGQSESLTHRQTVAEIVHTMFLARQSLEQAFDILMTDDGTSRQD